MNTSGSTFGRFGRFTREQVDELNRLLAGKTIDHIEFIESEGAINIITKESLAKEKK